MGLLIPLFWTSGDVPLGFKARVGSLIRAWRRLMCYKFSSRITKNTTYNVYFMKKTIRLHNTVLSLTRSLKNCIQLYCLLHRWIPLFSHHNPDHTVMAALSRSV